MISIVPFLPEHTKAAAAIHADSFFKAWSHDTFQQYAGNKNIIGFSAIYQNELAGLILAQVVDTEAEVLTFFVKPTLQGQGIGKDLLHFLLDSLLQQGTENVYLEVKQDNQRAKGLYLKAGFILTHVRPKYYTTSTGEKADGYNYKKDLTTTAPLTF